MENENGFNELLTLTQVARSIPGRPHISTVFRWCRVGIRGVRMGYVRFGRRMLVPREAMDRFATALADLDRAEDEARANVVKPVNGAPKGRSEKQRAKAIERAERECQAAGL